MSEEANSDRQELRPVAGEQNEVTKERSRDAVLDDLEEFYCESVGIRDRTLAHRLVIQAARMQVWEYFDGMPHRVVGAASTLRGLQPTNATEALLAVQMVAVHHAALMCLSRANVEDQTVESQDANALRAARLMRLFNEQLQAMSRLKGKVGPQKVTVKHVDVHEGGHAIVGAVSTANKGQGQGDPG